MGEPHEPQRQVAIITGGSRGLGRALATELARRGWALVLDARRAHELDAAAAELGTLTEVAALPGDVTNPAHRAALVDAATELGALSLVVNNASTLGHSPLPRLDAIDPGVLRDVFETNVVAPVALIQAALPHLVDGGTVVNVTSDAGVEAYEGWGGYGSSKAALEHLSRVLAAERPDLRVLIIDPGDMRTEMHQDAFPGEDISDRPEPEESVPGIVALLDRAAPSGRYEARAVTV
ncbi:MAG TPA: SDR family oxidoreductase [Acidimicrobiia bacterium]|jgi:NAD(P)-dependent dehydrogenase (short-subunit alcohol dehydrogenase family)|nr:SDR family oxidoreductase [Acidimicrobiia bacterium]